jgi:thiosulfate dehydrogenase [quinone] large subunit
MSQSIVTTKKGTVIEDPKIAKLLFSDTRFAVVWLVVRVVLGYSWVSAALNHINSAQWMDGTTLQGFWTTAVKVDTARPQIALDWYRGFIQSLLDSGAYTWFAKLVAFGELAVGVALIIGAFVGIAAFFGAFMNWNYLMAGSASINGPMLAITIFVILAWKIAGYYGLDYYLLPRLGTPWTRLQKHGEPAKEEELRSKPA